jgi:predicted RNase H-like nuclease (RuvC/YqgF family)
MSDQHPQSENMKALEQSLNDHMQICKLQRKVKNLTTKNTRLKAELVDLKSEAGRFKAEVERLRSASFVTAVPSEDYERLKAENERLRKAGDTMHSYITDMILGGRLINDYINKMLYDWEDAAEDGKPS